MAAVPGFAAAVGAAPAGAASTLSCGSVVTDSVTLTHDISGCAGSGLIIGAPGVTVDLNGHTIRGTGAGAGIDGQAGYDSVRVLDGTIEGFVFGVNLYEARSSRIENIHVTANLDGLKISRSDRLVIDEVGATGNAVNGIEITFSRGVVVRDVTATGNGLFGIVDRCSEATRVLGNRADGNDATGIVLDGVRSAIVRGNTSSANAGHGIQISGDDARVSSNAAVGNAGVGILADTDGVVDGGRNTASGNGEGDCIGVSC